MGAGKLWDLDTLLVPQEIAGVCFFVVFFVLSCAYQHHYMCGNKESVTKSQNGIKSYIIHLISRFNVMDL